MRLLAVFYVATAGLAVAALGLVGIASLVRVRFSFGIAVGLALGFFVLSSAVGLLSRPNRRSPAASHSTPSKNAE